MSMVVKPGYKQTEVGVIPKDWDVKQIGEIRPFVTSGSRGWAAFYSDRGEPFIRITNLSRSSIYPNLEDLRFVNLPKNDSEGARTQLQDNDVLISITADIGIVGYVSAKVPKPAYINQHIALVRFDKSATCPKFVSYFLASEKPQKLFKALTDSGAKAGMNLTTVQQIQLALPPTKGEQEAIAEALSDTDALIESLEQLLAKKRQVKQGAMQELLTGKKRLPGFSGEWEVKRLGEISSSGSGGTPPKAIAAYYDGDVPWVSISDMTKGGKVIFKTDRTLTCLGLASSAAQMFPIGTVLYAMYASIGECSLAGIALCSSQAILGIRPNDSLSSEFLFYFLTSLKPVVKAMGQQGTQSNLNAGIVRDFEMRLPSLPEQIAIATVLSDMDAEIENIETKLAKSRQIKQGMMQQLLTGKIRLVPKVSNIVPFQQMELLDLKNEKPHNKPFNDAVIISVLAKHFASEQYPLGRKRYTKFSYLLHRHAEHRAEGYLKKAAGPYNPQTRYGGAEKIAQDSGYIRQHQNGNLQGFVAGANVEKAEAYFQKWYGLDALQWLEQFRRRKNDELELLATVDMAMEDIRRDGQMIDLAHVKKIIRDNSEWAPKLQREIFSDSNIIRAIRTCSELFA
jgi:type I restriction enzyme S subunit